MLLGSLNADGSRKPGAVDKYCGTDTTSLIAKVNVNFKFVGFMIRGAVVLKLSSVLFCLFYLRISLVNSTRKSLLSFSFFVQR